MPEFLQGIKTLPPVGRWHPRQTRAKEGIVFLSRYRDNIYICFLNLSAFEVTWTKVIVARLLHVIYGIKRKWEKHGATMVWGEGSLCVEFSGLSLRRKGVPLMLGSVSPEWDNGVDVASPHARMVWRSQLYIANIPIPPPKKYLVCPSAGRCQR